MNPEIAWGVLTFVASSAFSAGVVFFTANSAKKETASIWKEIAKINERAGLHERDAGAARLEIEKAFGAIRETLAAKSSFYNEVIKRLDKIDAKIDKLETREERNG